MSGRLFSPQRDFLRSIKLRGTGEGGGRQEPGINFVGKSMGGRAWRREGRGRDIQWWEVGETVHNFSQQKKHTKVGTTKEGGGNREYKVRYLMC